MLASVTFEYSALWFLCVAALGVFALLGAGWRRNRKYSMLGGIRAVAQSVSYEVRLSFIILHSIIFFNYNMSQTKLVVLITFMRFQMMILMMTAMAETNRSPFDFAEGESELVRGFNTEFRSVHFLILFLGEYMSIMFMATLVSLLFNMRDWVDLFLYILL